MKLIIWRKEMYFFTLVKWRDMLELGMIFDVIELAYSDSCYTSRVNCVLIIVSWSPSRHVWTAYVSGCVILVMNLSALLKTKSTEISYAWKMFNVINSLYASAK